jgi:hypothetical protein
MEKPYGLVRFRWIAPGIVPANQSLYKLEKQSGPKSFRPTNPAETNKAYSCSTTRNVLLNQKAQSSDAIHLNDIIMTLKTGRAVNATSFSFFSFTKSPERICIIVQ